ncbi:GNAT family N-acetyltransferase [Hungatella effluvii]|uniref:GNAT family N-acetyltransferase n=1 Tax=Hungatella effluvii TaxID=1096246 RepID=UPI0032217FB1
MYTAIFLSLKNIPPHIIIAEAENGTPVAFVGVELVTLEMVFIAPKERGKMLGKRLFRYSIEQFAVKTLAVSEQNPQAKVFCERMVFHVYKRTKCDEQENSYLLLYMTHS